MSSLDVWLRTLSNLAGVHERKKQLVHKQQRQGLIIRDQIRSMSKDLQFLLQDKLQQVKQHDLNYSVQTGLDCCNALLVNESLWRISTYRDHHVDLAASTSAAPTSDSLVLELYKMYQHRLGVAQNLGLVLMVQEANERATFEMNARLASATHLLEGDKMLVQLKMEAMMRDMTKMHEAMAKDGFDYMSRKERSMIIY